MRPRRPRRRETRRCIGIEINPEWSAIYDEVCEKCDIDRQETIVGDCMEIMPTMD